MDYNKCMNETTLKKKYLATGAQFGYVIGHVFEEKCIGFEMMLNVWSDYEKEYSNRGYKTIPIDNFINLGYRAKDIVDVFNLVNNDLIINNLLDLRLGENEKPILYAQLYKKIYFDKTNSKKKLNDIIDENKILQFELNDLPSKKYFTN